MPCCGKGRSQITLTGATAGGAKAAPANSMFQVYEYTGQTAMTVVGRTTGATYRFARPGARVQVDRRDFRSLSGVPNVRQIPT